MATKDRPDHLRLLLESLAAQTRPVDLVVVVDASAGDETRRACEECAPMFAAPLRYERTAPGLPAQRQRAIDVAASEGVEFVCLFDDDFVLHPACCEVMAAFFESDDGAAFGGLCAYDEAGWGRPFSALDRLYHRLGIFDGPLLPGRWLYCGRFLELEHLPPHLEGVWECDFLAGGATMWRVEVLRDFPQPLTMAGYALGEDKHFSLRVRTRYRLGVHGGARVEHRSGQGGRPGRLGLAFKRVRMEALLIRDCDPHPKWRRYAAFIGATLLDGLVQAAWRTARGRFRDLDTAAARLAGAMACAFFPPRPTAAGLGGKGVRAP